MCWRLGLVIVALWTSGCGTCRPSPTVMLEPDPTLTWAIQGAVPITAEQWWVVLDDVVDGAALGVRCRGW
jgi:hypothetical protein